MKLKQYQVDAFTEKVFGGNPAAVVQLSSWLDDSLLQAIAQENNFSETAFFIPSDKGFKLRWFTPAMEVNLCGHATLATAHIIFEILGYSKPVITFETRSGELHVRKNGKQLEMNFPSCPSKPCTSFEALTRGLGQRPLRFWQLTNTWLCSIARQPFAPSYPIKPR